MADNEEKMVRLNIDGVDYEVPAGMNLVDAAKLCGNDIPVFCYHPKLGHAANCRMCLVELGLPRKDPATGEVSTAWGRVPTTACNQYVSDGMSIRTTTKAVIDGRREILEFLLSSHPLDCPICDKGGECPLQNLTMRHGPGTSRMYWDDRMRLGKHVPLGDLIYLDRERCIHCARCIRFQEIIAGDPVLGFDYRGRRQQIITHSDPGFDSIFSGNTTDICPVGALTTADFRFNARPWEMEQVATLDSYGPEGANMYFDTRVDRESGGRTVIKRVMPRQNEAVNEIWISDKARFGRHYMEHADRLRTPLIRKGGQFVEATWEEAISVTLRGLKDAGDSLAVIGGPRLSNEDYFAWKLLAGALGSKQLAGFPANVAGGELVQQIGVGVDTDLQQLGKGDAILVAASDLHEEAPVWWLRVKRAAERGAQLFVVAGHGTRLDQYAKKVIRAAYGEEATAIAGNKELTAAFTEARNAVAFVGGEGLDATGSRAAAQAAANLLSSSGHVGKPNNGLILVWPGANLQGAFDMGFTGDYAAIVHGLEGHSLKALVLAGAEIAYEDAAAARALRVAQGNSFIVATAMFMDESTQYADVVLPVQSIAEREGTYTSGERRVQRFYPAIEPVGESRADWSIVSALLSGLGGEALPKFPAAVFKQIAASVPAYSGLTYMALAEVEQQFPDVGGEDLYFGGTSFQNRHGLGVQTPTQAEQGVAFSAGRIDAPVAVQAPKGGLLAIPVTLHFDREPAFARTSMVDGRISAPCALINPTDAQKLGIAEGDSIEMSFEGRQVTLAAHLDEQVPPGVALVPRRLQAQGAPAAAAPAQIARLEASPA